ncbi:hypothetical protein ACETK8_15495 [Brevundimonas staleyi]|uniref:DUF6894 family protein n=1 Tax=Brevundimonas staleyi TaxID=74326 RepID=A0ABW0FWV4_9CAUL
MPRYFFRLKNGETLMDEDGEDLVDHDAACAAAIDVFAETLPDRRALLANGGDYEVLVTDADDGPVYSITAQGRRF